MRSLTVLWVLVLSSAWAQTPVYFEDTRLKTAVEDALWVNDPTPADMQGLFELTCSNTINDGVKSLVGLEHATHLASLTLSYNEISDLSPLQHLTELNTLIVNDNSISDLSALAGLTGLKKLDIHRNKVTDISVLSRLTDLNHLVIRLNHITDISVLAHMPNLQWLNAQNCRISDISVLSGLTGLTRLSLQGNRITDLSALAGLSDLEMLLLHDNRIQDISALTEMYELSLLTLQGNAMNEPAYARDLADILNNMPRLRLTYSPNEQPVGNLTASMDRYADRVELSWDAVNHGPLFTAYYQVLRSTEEAPDKTPISPWSTERSFEDSTIAPGVTAFYWVQSATSDLGSHRGPYSDRVTGRRLLPPAQISTLTLTSTVGGAVTEPGEGHFQTNREQPLSIQAMSTDPNLFAFSHWTGSALTLTDSNAPAISVSVPQDAVLQAHFVSYLDTLYVDANSPIQGTGTAQSPLTRIQDAIDAAQDHAVIQVAAGTYYETLDFLGKPLQITGMDPNTPWAALPVIDCNGQGIAVNFSSGEDAYSSLTGFTIQNSVVAILCDQSSPTISHCVIVGNRSSDPNEGAVTCIQSTPLLEHCTITDNLLGMASLNSDPMLINSILWGNEQDVLVSGIRAPDSLWSNAFLGHPKRTAFYLDPLFVRSGDWIVPEDPALIGSIEDPNSLWVPGDYHLQSLGGHWDDTLQTWLPDEMTSPSIDTGYPYDNPGQEPLPNGDLVNQGAYGATPQASKSW